MSITTQNATYAVAKINSIDLMIVENGQKMVPIKPICDILGVDSKAQMDKIKTDPILGPTAVLSTSVGADGKDREMFCIPLKFVFGWLFTINSDRVSPDAQDAVIRYKLECYDALYNHFERYADYVQYRTVLIEEKTEALEQIKSDFQTAKEKLDQVKMELLTAQQLPFAAYCSIKSQMVIPFESEGGE